MIRPLAFFHAVVAWAGMVALSAAQVPAPPIPPLSQEQKAAAAAIQAPQPAMPPPLPGQLQGAPPQAAAPSFVAPAPVVVPSAPVPVDATTSKMQALEAATQQPSVQEATRLAAPSDKIPITSSTSTSGQFIVHGKVFETRSAMSSRCEEISRDLRKVLNDKEPWVLPVVVLLNTGEAAAKTTGKQIDTVITEMSHGGFHVQVTINDRGGLTEENLRTEVVRALLAERILRNHQKITKPEDRLLLPDWIMTGVLHGMDYKSSARPSAIFSTIFRSGKIYGIEEIIAASPVEMDGLSRSIYETSCCALVLALADQPGGPQRFNKFLNTLASDPRSERDLLNAAFPTFAASASSLNKWWSLQLAALSKPGIAEPFTPADSLQAIEDAVLIRYMAKPEEVPQNVKQRPFVLPQSLAFTPPAVPMPVVSAPAAQGETHAPSKPRETAASPTSAPKTGDNSEETAGDEEPKRALWRRLLFLGASKPDEPVETSAIPEEKKEKEDLEKEKDKESKPGFFGRLLGGGSDKKKTEDEPSEAPADKEKTKPVVAEKPKTPAPPAAEKAKAPADEPKPKEKSKDKGDADKGKEEDDKPSKLNPMNWFRGGKKPAEEKKSTDNGEKDEAEKPAKEKQAAVLPAEDFNLARLISPALADAWQVLAPAAPRQTVDPLFFLRKKSKPEEQPKEEAPKPAASAPAPKKPSTRSAASKSGKPRTTNPNATSTAKPEDSSPGAPRTSNPNSRPVPAAMVPVPTTTGAAAGPAAASNGLVPVILPLEEYKHVMKREDRAEIFDRNIATLRALELRVGILYRPVILNYLAIVTDLKEGKTKDMDKRIATLRQFSVIAYQKSVAVRDYLDWFEASEGTALSGKFKDYLDLPAIIEKELPSRTDPISQYLEAIDKEFSK